LKNLVPDFVEGYEMRYSYTRKAIQDAQPSDKPYKLPKEMGLCVLVFPNGTKGWRHSITVRGRETTLAYGNWPEVSLKEARDRRDDTRRQLRDGINPAAVRKAEKEGNRDTFRAIAEEWLAAGCPGGRKGVNEDTKAGLRKRLENYVFPRVGGLPISDVTAPELLRLLRRIESKGTHETAHRVRSLCSRIFRYAIGTGRAERDPAADLIGALAPTKTQHFAAITKPRRIGELLRAIDSYSGQPTTMFALKLSPYVFVRPSDLRKAEWSEFDFDAREWRIPARRMKMDDEHVVPLSRQAIAILKELHRYTGHGRLVFPSIKSADRPISENTINGALRRLDFAGDEMTGHGFRTLASTRLNEMGFPPDVIELQLAHKERNETRAAYNRAERIADRRKMMQKWGDYLDRLRAGTSNVVPLRA
jgi:integrase